MSPPQKRDDLEAWIRYKVDELGTGKTDAYFSLRLEVHPLINALVSPLLQHEADAIRQAAILALSSAGNDEIVTTLLSMLDSEVDGPTVAEALGKIGSPSALGPMVEQLKRTPKMAGLRLGLSRLKDESAVEPILAAENQPLFSEEGITALVMLPAPDAVPKLRKTLVYLGKVQRDRYSFDSLWHSLTKALARAGWEADGSLSGILVRSYRQLDRLDEAGEEGLTWLLTHWQDLPEYELNSAQQFITSRYQYGSTGEREILEQYRDKVAGKRRFSKTETIDLPFSYYFDPVGSRPNFAFRSDLCRNKEEIKGLAPYLPLMLTNPDQPARQRFTSSFEHEEIFKRYGAELYARLRLRIEPTTAHRSILVTNWVEESRLYVGYTKYVLEVIYQLFLEEGIEGETIGGLDITIVDGVEHPIDSKPIAFKIVTKTILNLFIEKVERVSI